MQDIDEDSFKNFLLETALPWCWWCGRTAGDRPAGWGAPAWLIERAHIVNNPRVKDRRVCVLLCSLCHKVQHGEQLVLLGMQSLVAPTLAELLWLKSQRDKKYYNRTYMQRFSIRQLPRARAPREEVLRAYWARVGSRLDRGIGLNV